MQQANLITFNKFDRKFSNSIPSFAIHSLTISFVQLQWQPNVFWENWKKLWVKKISSFHFYITITIKVFMMKENLMWEQEK